LIYLKQIFLQNKPYQQILLKIKEYCGKWQNLKIKFDRMLFSSMVYPCDYGFFSPTLWHLMVIL